MILQDAARRGTGLARLIGLAWALGQRRAGNGAAADADAGATRIGVAGHPRARQAARWSRATSAPSSRPGTTLAAEIGAKVQRLAVTEGGAFKKDQLLVQFDCSLQQAQLNKAHAGQNAADKTWRAPTSAWRSSTRWARSNWRPRRRKCRRPPPRWPRARRCWTSAA